MPYILVPPQNTGNASHSTLLHSGVFLHYFRHIQVCEKFCIISPANLFDAKKIQKQKQCISDVLFSVHRVNFLPIVDFENKIDLISTAYIHLNLVMQSPVHAVPNTQHFQFVIVSAVGVFITDWMKFFIQGAAFLLVLSKPYSKSSQCFLRE